jgi:hypothetical protein
MIPAVEGLIPEPHNGKIMILLFRLAEWHALAKLRLHTECTLNFLSQSTVTIGRELRSFEEWTQVFKTVELPGEADARDRRRRRRKPPTLESEPQLQQANKSPAQLKTKPNKKLFNLFTYKLHALGDYVSTIRSFGTTDSYSTQIVRPGLSALLDTVFNFLAGRTCTPLSEALLSPHQQKRCNTTNCET